MAVHNHGKEPVMTTGTAGPGTTQLGTTGLPNTVGVVGLGAMGSQIASRLLEAGYQVHATNRTRPKAQPLIERGLHWQNSPRAVAAAANVVISMVTDDDALQTITGGPDGLLAGLAPG